jgi:hypothetical protein
MFTLILEVFTAILMILLLIAALPFIVLSVVVVLIAAAVVAVGFGLYSLGGWQAVIIVFTGCLLAIQLHALSRVAEETRNPTIRPTSKLADPWDEIESFRNRK